ncbi:MAG: mononuclear molybdenum enzyme YedY, partial [Nitrospina sp.]|nr:mononuclear molybdenum enzyme YedY [Nitrospina sp.]
FYEPFTAHGQLAFWEPWPYVEGLTIKEAMNELAFLATGIYGHPIPKQHGAPIRLVVPWKYGFKNIKSIVKIELVNYRPATFWNTLQGLEYDFTANVNPKIPHPRWPQTREKMIGSGDIHDTLLYNGYGDFVSYLYS